MGFVIGFIVGVAALAIGIWVWLVKEFTSWW